jgi:hypothetical protein
VPRWTGCSVERNKQNDPTIIYKWVEGSDIKDYSKSAQNWNDFTGNEDFIYDFRKLVESTSSTNEDRAEAVE